MARQLDPMFQDLSPCIKRVGYWLLLLTRPGQTIVFIPSEMGVKSATIQQYVWQLSEVLGVRYRVTGGLLRNADRTRRDQEDGTPLTVTRLRS